MPEFDTILLDTNVLSQYAKEFIKKPFLTFMEQFPAEKFAIPFPVLVEINCGIASIQTKKPLRALRLRRWIRLMMASDITFLAADSKTAMIYGDMLMKQELSGLCVIRKTVRKKELMSVGLDPMIAATSIAYNYPIATCDLKDFSLIDQYFPLPGVYDPSQGRWIERPELQTIYLKTHGLAHSITDTVPI